MSPPQKDIFQYSTMFTQIQMCSSVHESWDLLIYGLLKGKNSISFLTLPFSLYSLPSSAIVAGMLWFFPFSEKTCDLYISLFLFQPCPDTLPSAAISARWFQNIGHAECVYRSQNIVAAAEYQITYIYTRRWLTPLDTLGQWVNKINGKPLSHPSAGWVLPIKRFLFKPYWILFTNASSRITFLIYFYEMQTKR